MSLPMAIKNRHLFQPGGRKKTSCHHHLEILPSVPVYSFLERRLLRQRRRQRCTFAWHSPSHVHPAVRAAGGQLGAIPRSTSVPWDGGAGRACECARDEWCGAGQYVGAAGRSSGISTAADAECAKAPAPKPRASATRTVGSTNRKRLSAPERV